MYKPLPDELTIKPSKIHGLGLFAVVDLKKDYEFGISHVMDDNFTDGYIRTPIGGFFNHSSNPNCEAYKKGTYIRLKAIKDIVAGEEITAHYWLYAIKEQDEIV